MCGIAGVVSDKPEVYADPGVFKCVQDVLLRRGPDQRGVFVDPGGAALIHTRLSIVDMENGVQPMVFSRGEEEYIIVYNGELYNTPEIREELESLGHTFKSYSDTEALLLAYVQWKERCVDRLNGIYAFAVWEKRSRRLFAARDRIGVKPFFYAVRDGVFLFASELKALLRHPLVEPEIDEKSVAEIMLIGPGRTPGCGVFKGIEELRPGECGFFSVEKGLRVWRYWRLSDAPHTDTFEETAEKTRSLVMDAIRRQLVSDTPVCTFLSGGLDSSVISSVAAEAFRRKGMTLHTFSVDYKDNARYFTANKFQPNSDEEYINIMSNYIGSEHHKVIIDSRELADALYAAVDARDLPGMADVDSSLLLFCSEIKKHAKVALSGECADEIFGGYPWYRDKDIREREGFPWAQSTRFRASFLRPEWNIDEEYVKERYETALQDVSILPENAGERRFKEMVNLNFDWFMQTLLDRKDRMSMYNGLEVRVPFCDYRIAEYLYSTPWEFKDWQGREKGLLRFAMEGALPAEVLWRKKSPYPKTHNPAYLKIVSDRLRDIISDANAPALQIVRKDALERLLDNDSPTPWYGQLMTAPQTMAYFLQIDYWLRKYSVKIA
ncbi:MAG: asparagine synthase (glutamine-hydrolyzing) [Clostridiales bacterium]|jgi:asparagine synthase (glutamine-hydrolysing)|nr:asparagine synthase (glutamine-hydrolyzing) [Clostridiales bacterium]